MSRKRKDGLDYYPQDTNFFDNEKVECLKNKFPSYGIEVFLRLLHRIYRNSYFFMWNEEYVTIHSSKIMISEEEYVEAFNLCFKIGLFSFDKFNDHKIITSKSIQEQYVMSVNMRRNVDMVQEYLLIDPNNIKNGFRRSRYGDIKITTLKEMENINGTCQTPQWHVPKELMARAIKKDDIGIKTDDNKEWHVPNPTMARAINKEWHVPSTQSKVKKREERRLTPLSSLSESKKKPPAGQQASLPAAFFLEKEEVREREDQDIEDIISQVADIRIEKSKKSKKKIESRVGFKKYLRRVYDEDPEEAKYWLEEILEEKERVRAKKEKIEEQERLNALFSDDLAPQKDPESKNRKIDKDWEEIFLTLPQNKQNMIYEEAEEHERQNISERSSGAVCFPDKYRVREIALNLIYKYRKR